MRQQTANTNSYGMAFQRLLDVLTGGGILYVLRRFLESWLPSVCLCLISLYLFVSPPVRTELDFVPTDPSITDPTQLILHVPDSGGVGIAYCAVVPLYAQAAAALQKLLPSAAPPVGAVSDAADAVTKALLVINAGHGSAWNLR